MVSPKILVVRRRHLSDLRAWIVGSSSGTHPNNNNRLTHGPNATRARAYHISTLGGHRLISPHFAHTFTKHLAGCE